jgi:hypothetical protein
MRNTHSAGLILIDYVRMTLLSVNREKRTSESTRQQPSNTRTSVQILIGQGVTATVRAIISPEFASASFS